MSQPTVTRSSRRPGNRCGHRGYFVPVLASLVLAFFPAAPASADLVIGSPGAGAGQYESPRGVAVDTVTGHVYVSDTGNNRVDVFDSSGTFLFAFGWKVNATAPEEKLQTCTTLAGCQKGSPGGGAGQINNPAGIAVDSSSHDVYVAEESSHRIQKFDSSGGFLLTFGKDVNTGTSGKPDLCTNAGAPTDVCRAGVQGFAADQFNQRVQVAVGPGGTVHVADSLVSAKDTNHFQKFNPGGEAIGAPIDLTGAYGDATGLAVDSSGDLYFGETSHDEGDKSFLGGVQKFDPTGSVVTGWGDGGKVDPSFNVDAVALDPAGDLFVGDPTGATTQMLEYGSGGVESLVFFGNGTLLRRPVALAFYHSAGGDLLAVEEGSLGRVVQIALPEPDPVLVPGSTTATGVGSVRATLGVTFNPEGQASHARFQYITKQNFDKDGEKFGAGTLETPNSLDSKAVFVNESVEATNACVVPTAITCLEPETTYYFRSIASNATGEVTGEKAEFTTRPPLEIDSTWATEVGTDSARLHAEVNPIGVGATAYFQYIQEGADYQAHGFENAVSVPSPVHPIDFGAGELAVVGATEVYPLEPGTIYHYRLIASDSYFAPIVSAEHVFTTFALLGATGAEECSVNEALRTGPSAALADCRAYEMVSPPDKGNGDIRTLINVLSYPTFLDQSSTAGSGFTYSSDRAFANPTSAPYANQFLAARHERGESGEGWSSEALDPLGKGSEFLENPYKAFSPDLSSAWLTWLSSAGEPTPDPCAPVGFTDLYRHDTTGGAFQALGCGAIKNFDSLENQNYLPEIQGFSADGTHAVFRADEALAAGASAATTVSPSLRPIYQVYESTGAGPVRLVSVLPNGEASSVDSSVGTVGETNPQAHWNYNRFGSLAHAVSDDETRVFWSTGGEGFGTIYLRMNADQAQSKMVAGKCSEAKRACTVRVSETVTLEGARFEVGNPQGTKALFTVRQGPLAGNLYEFDATVEPAVSHLIATGVMENILGASEDLSRVYFASEEASVGEQVEGAVQGKPNVYLAAEGTTRFIATLSAGGETSDVGNPYGTPIERTIFHAARVSADGTSVVFMSNSLALSERTAGYDNTDAVSGRADSEVYLYDASANNGKGRLRCVSCNPSGARPTGRELEKGSNKEIGPWGAARVPVFENQLYQPRYLSDDGKRVFFDSYDALVLGDTNGKEDVYEWEMPGTGNCTTESSLYVAGSGGCLSLISSGGSPADSEFLDASPAGSDAFFLTAEGLVSQDPGLIDVYDARVDGGFPPPPAALASCEGEACQGAPVAPLDTTPASFAFTGPGNPTPILTTPKAKTKPKVKPCGKGRVRKRGRCVKRKRAAKKGSVNKGRAGRSSRRAVRRNGRTGR